MDDFIPSPDTKRRPVTADDENALLQAQLLLDNSGQRPSASFINSSLVEGPACLNNQFYEVGPSDSLFTPQKSPQPATASPASLSGPATSALLSSPASPALPGCNRSGVGTGPEVGPGCGLSNIIDDSSLN